MKHIRLMTANVDFALRPVGVGKDLDRIDDDIDILCFQEAKNVDIDHLLKDPDWRVHQDLHTDAVQGSGVAWRKSRFKFISKGRRIGVKAGRHDMNDRWLYWVTLETSFDNKTQRFKVVSGHLPPKDTWVLHPAMMRNIEAIIKTTDVPVLVGADWNKLVNNAPGGLPALPGGRYYGHHIDGFWVDNNFRVLDTNVGPDTRSDHRPIKVLVSPRKF